jgi:L-serine dehydratase
MKYYPDFFNDVFGPVMQPGSSSHMAGPVRLGLLARSLLGEAPESVRFVMDRNGSFAGTFGIMNEDKGMLAGVMGFGPADERIFRVREIAASEGIKFEYVFDTVEECGHINTIRYCLRAADGKEAVLTGVSTGGGMVQAVYVNGFPVDFIGDTYVLLVFSEIKRDQTEAIVLNTGGFVECGDAHNENGALHYMKFSEKPDMELVKRILPEGIRIELMEPVLPVVMHRERKPQLFKSVQEWERISKELGIGMAETAIQYEMDSSLLTREEVIARMRSIKDILLKEIGAFYDHPDGRRDPFGRYDGDLWLEYEKKGTPLTGPVFGQIVKRVMGVNSKIPGTPIVPGPMGTGGGYLFSALYTVKEAYGFDDDSLLRGLFVAAGIGAIAYTRTNPTGEVVGCAGECGVCCAMGAAAIAEMAGAGDRIDTAASFALQTFIGLPCDPVVGGYEAPCYSRMISAASLAVVFSDLAIAGADAVIPYDQMLDAIDRVGRNLSPDLLCTSRGGTCTAPAARSCEASFKQWMDSKSLSR